MNGLNLAGRGGLVLRDFLRPKCWAGRVRFLTFGVCWEAICLPSPWRRVYQFGLTDGVLLGEARLEAPGFSHRIAYGACDEVVAEAVDFLLDTPACPGQLPDRPADNQPYAWLELRMRGASLCARTFMAGDCSSTWEASLNARGLVLQSVRPSLAIRMLEPPDVRLRFLEVVEAARKEDRFHQPPA